MPFLTDEEIAAMVLPPNGVDEWTARSLDAAGVLFLAKCLLREAQSTLTCLDVSYNQVDDSDATALAASLEKNTTLTSLNFGNNRVGAAGAAALAASLEKNTTLTSLHVSWNQVGVAGATALAASLKKNTTLTSLHVSWNQVGAAGATALAAGLEKNTALTNLGVGGNQVGDFGATALAASLQTNTTLTSLNLEANQVGDAGATALAASLEKNMTLTRLDVSSNQVGDTGATALAAILEENTTLTSLDVGNNHVGDAGATALAASLEKNTTLTSLDVSSNRVCTAGATALAASLEKDTTLTNLNVSWNRVGVAGASALAASLEKNTTLTSLHVGNNQVGNAGVTALAASLEKNTTLTSLNVSWNQVGDVGPTALAASLEKNTTLTTLVVTASAAVRAAIGTALELNRSLPKWNVTLGVRPGWRGCSSLDASGGNALCIDVPTVSSLAFLLNQVVAKVGEYLRSTSYCLTSPAARWRRRITSSQLRVLDGTSLEPIACATDDSGFLRDGKCVRSISGATINREVHLFVSFGVIHVAFVYALEQNTLRALESSDRACSSGGSAAGGSFQGAPQAIDQADRSLIKRRLHSSEHAGTLNRAAGQQSRRKHPATSNSNASVGRANTSLVSHDARLSRPGEAQASSASDTSTVGNCDALDMSAPGIPLLTTTYAAVATSGGVYSARIPREVGTLLFAYIRSYDV